MDNDNDSKSKLKAEKEKVRSILKDYLITIENCGHLPHLDKPKYVAQSWLKRSS